MPGYPGSGDSLRNHGDGGRSAGLAHAVPGLGWVSGRGALAHGREERPAGHPGPVQAVADIWPDPLRGDRADAEWKGL